MIRFAPNHISRVKNLNLGGVVTAVRSGIQLLIEDLERLQTQAEKLQGEAPRPRGNDDFDDGEDDDVEDIGEGYEELKKK